MVPLVELMRVVALIEVVRPVLLQNGKVVVVEFFESGENVQNPVGHSLIGERASLPLKEFMTGICLLN